MWRILDTWIEIEAAHDLLKKRFAVSLSRMIPVTIIYPPKDVTVVVRWFPDHQFWVFFDLDDRMIFGGSKKVPKNEVERMKEELL